MCYLYRRTGPHGLGALSRAGASGFFRPQTTDLLNLSQPTQLFFFLKVTSFESITTLRLTIGTPQQREVAGPPALYNVGVKTSFLVVETLHSYTGARYYYS